MEILINELEVSVGIVIMEDWLDVSLEALFGFTQWSCRHSLEKLDKSARPDSEVDTSGDNTEDEDEDNKQDPK